MNDIYEWLGVFTLSFAGMGILGSFLYYDYRIRKLEENNK